MSLVFVRPKKDGTHRTNLNLKCLNADITYHHFKMDNLQTALKLVTQNCYKIIDLKDAYCSVPKHKNQRKFLRFKLQGNLWQFNCMPNGLALAPRKFTKLLKSIFATLREKGHLATAFLDDSLLAETRVSCTNNVVDTIRLFRSLGFIVHLEKSVLEPTHCIQYFGVIIDSAQITVTLTPERMADLRSCCKTMLTRNSLTIRDVAKVIGKIVEDFPAVIYGPLYYRQLEKEKKTALTQNKGDSDSHMHLSKLAKEELPWCVNNLPSACNDIQQSDPEITLTSDASLSGWGCALGDTQTGGQWLPVESLYHINYLELKAAYFSLQCFQHQVKDKHVRILVDNTTAVACINHMGTSHSDECNMMAQMTWQWCIQENVWLNAAHVPGRLNKAADAESRNLNSDAEWKLNERNFSTPSHAKSTTDLFASRLNNQMKDSVSYTLRASLFGTFLKTPDLVTPLKGHYYLRAALQRRGQRPPKGSGTNVTVEATQTPSPSFNPTAVFSYAIGSRKLSANEQFFVGAQTVVSLLQTTQIKQVGGQLRGDKECPFSGVTKSGRVWMHPPRVKQRVPSRFKRLCFYLCCCKFCWRL